MEPPFVLGLQPVFVVYEFGEIRNTDQHGDSLLVLENHDALIAERHSAEYLSHVRAELSHIDPFRHVDLALHLHTVMTPQL